MANNKPSGFIIGQSKSGTTAMFNYLRRHPDIFTPRIKEPYFFANDLCKDPRPGSSFFQLSEASYIDLFADARPDQLCIEASACYLYSKVAARKIREFDASARMIAMFREPVSFLHSYHLQQLRNPVAEGDDVTDFQKALRLEESRKQGLNNPKGCFVPELNFYSERVKYAEQLARYFEEFPRDQIEVLIYDDFKKDNAHEVKKVVAFLGLQPLENIEPLVFNKGYVVRSRKGKRIFEQFARGEGWTSPFQKALKTAIPKPARKKIMGQVYSAFRKPKSKLDDELVFELKSKYKNEVEKFSNLIGRDLVTEWGYANL